MRPTDKGTIKDAINGWNIEEIGWFDGTNNGQDSVMVHLRHPDGKGRGFISLFLPIESATIYLDGEKVNLVKE